MYDNLNIFLFFRWVSETLLTMSGDSTTPWSIGPGSPVELSCDTFMVKNQTKYDFTNGEYGGVPFNLIINSVGWVVSLPAFLWSLYGLSLYWSSSWNHNYLFLQLNLDLNVFSLLFVAAYIVIHYSEESSLGLWKNCPC